MKPADVRPLSTVPDGWEIPVLDDRGSGPYRLLHALQRSLVRRFLRSVLEPEQAQVRALRRVLDAARGTRFARQHGLASVRSFAEYRAAVPVLSFDDHAPGLRREAAGQARSMVRHRVRSFVKTSGTTGEPKLLPVTGPWARAVSEAQALWVLAMVREQEEVTRGRALTTVGEAVEGHTSGGVPFGSNTGRMQAAQPWLVRRRYAVPGGVFSLDDVDLRHYVLLRLSLAWPVTTWTTANPSTVLALARAVERWREPLLADLADGTLHRGPAASLDPRQRRRWLRGVPRRALPDGFRLGTAWPLAAINCWKGGAAPFFLERLPRALGASPTVRDPGLSASEGYFGIPLHSTWSGGVAWTGGHLLELLPEGGGEPVLPHQAQLGREYRLVVSTTAGLYRYDLNDVVRVDGRYGRAPVLTFLRKGLDVLSVTGEKVTADQVGEAARRVLGDVAGFSVGVRMGERPTYVLCVEGQQVDGVAAAFDRALATLNPEYAGKRATDRLAPAQVVWLRAGTFRAQRREALARGAAEGQVKDAILLHGDALERLVGTW